MQILVCINNSHIILSYQLLHTTNSLPLRLIELNAVSFKDLTTQWRRPRRNHRIERINAKTSMVINKRLKIGSLTIKNSNNDGVTFHQSTQFDNKLPQAHLKRICHQAKGHGTLISGPPLKMKSPEAINISPKI